MAFIGDLRSCADLSGASLARLSAGEDRYGPVAAILFASPGFISVRLRNDGDCIVTAWAHAGLVASGQTSSLEDIVTTMREWQDGRPVRDLLNASPYLEATDPQAVAETLWRLLIDHGEPYLQPIVTAAAGIAALRSLRPWISHGTLHLLHADDAVTGTRLGRALQTACAGRARLPHRRASTMPPVGTASRLRARADENAQRSEGYYQIMIPPPIALARSIARFILAR